MSFGKRDEDWVHTSTINWLFGASVAVLTAVKTYYEIQEIRQRLGGGETVVVVNQEQTEEEGE